jgi:hypothetical protein
VGGEFANIAGNARPHLAAFEHDAQDVQPAPTGRWSPWLSAAAIS